MDLYVFCKLHAACILDKKFCKFAVCEEPIVEQEPDSLIISIPQEIASRPIVYFISGGFGGILSVLVGHPLDTIKVKLQTMPEPKRGKPPMYTGTVDCFMKTLRQEGVINGVYRGMSAPLLSTAPLFALSFFGFGLGKSILESFGANPDCLKPYQLCIAGSIAGMISASVMAPAERIKLVLQTQLDRRPCCYIPEYSGPFDVIVKLYREGGIKSIYKGSGMTMMRDIPASGVYFMTYELLLRWIPDNSISTEDHFDVEKKPVHSVARTCTAGGLAGIICGFIFMPIDVLKSMLQTAKSGTYPNGVRDAYKELYDKKGFFGLFKGLTPVMLRAFPANAACFTGFEICKTTLNNAMYEKR